MKTNDWRFNQTCCWLNEQGERQQKINALYTRLTAARSRICVRLCVSLGDRPLLVTLDAVGWFFSAVEQVRFTRDG